MNLQARRHGTDSERKLPHSYVRPGLLSQARSVRFFQIFAFSLSVQY